LAIRAQEPVAQGTVHDMVQNQRAEGASTSDHSDCLMFGAQRERYANQALHAQRLGQVTGQVSAIRASTMGTGTTMSAASMPTAPGGSRTSSADTTSTNLIDGYIFPAL